MCLIIYNVLRTWSRLLISVSDIGPLVAEFLGNIQLWVCLMLHPFVNVSWRKDAFLVICDTESWGLRGNSGQVPRPSRNELPLRGLWSYIGVVLICVEFAAHWAGNPDGQKWMLTKYMGEDAEGAWRLHDKFVNDLVDSDWMKGFVDSGRLWVDSAFLWFGQSKGKALLQSFSSLACAWDFANGSGSNLHYATVLPSMKKYNKFLKQNQVLQGTSKRSIFELFT